MTGRIPLLVAGIAIAGLTLGGCTEGSGSGRVASASAVVARASPDDRWIGRDDVKEAIALLQKGDAVRARKRLMRVLKKQPGDNIARQLLSQIDSEPRVLLGTANYSYTLAEGDTLVSIAQRRLGNPMMFYALARYNGIAVPEAVAVGQTILIPGARPVPPAPPKATRATTKPAPSVASPVSEVPAKSAPQPARAARLRGQGLAAMNAGTIDRAVALLREALNLDPDSPAIKHDLSRALRIQETLRVRR